MPSRAAAIGPWPKGLNTNNDISAIGDDEVSQIVNFDIDSSGTLVSRPAIITEKTPSSTNANMRILGTATSEAGTQYLVVADTSADKTWLYAVVAQTWTEIWGHAASGFTQYLNRVVLISTATAGGYWDLGTPGWTTTATMPLGEGIVLFQARFWAFGAKGTDEATTIWFSNIDAASVTEDASTVIWDWTTASDYFIVGSGDGQWITALRATPTGLLIWRNLSTWIYTFPSSPLDGTLRVLSQTVGADTKWAIADYESYFFTFCRGTLYQFINLTYYPISRSRVNFTAGDQSGNLISGFELVLSRFSTKVIVWYRSAVYVYDASTGSFTTWDSATSAAQFVELPSPIGYAENVVAYAVTGENTNAKKVLLKMQSTPIAVGAGESFTCSVSTRSIDFATPSEYKRLYYWVAEIASAKGVSGYLQPIGIPFSPATWDELDDITWDSLDSANWDAPLSVISEIIDDVPFPLPAPVRLTVRLLWSGRFQRIVFRVSIDTDGTVSSAPVKVYGLTPYVAEKARTSRKVS